MFWSAVGSVYGAVTSMWLFATMNKKVCRENVIFPIPNRMGVNQLKNSENNIIYYNIITQLNILRYLFFDS